MEAVLAGIAVFLVGVLWPFYLMVKREEEERGKW